MLVLLCGAIGNQRLDSVDTVDLATKGEVVGNVVVIW
jgi:hypothetical protein